ncbi:MAG: sporulation integral membrane protein YtvI [Caldicoprobacteraceae bacterium]|jgi:sporulation integral membrane protein YtvI
MIQLNPKHKRYLKTTLWILLILSIILLVLIKVVPYVAPFVVALLITFMIERPVRYVSKKARLPRGVAVAIMLAAFILIIGGGLTLIFSNIVNEIWRLAREFPSAQKVMQYIEIIFAKTQDFFLDLPPDIEQSIRDALGSFVGNIASYLQRLLNYIMGIARFLPQFFLFIIISLVASFFMSRDREKVSGFVYKQIPEDWRIKIRSIKEDLLAALLGFIKAQFILISVTFIELLIGYSLIGVKYAFSFALLTAFVDALPILGTGTVLIPAAAFNLVIGNVPRAIGFIGLYIVIMVVRQSLEPKIMGQNLGLHPLVTLISIYVGMQIFGIIGLFLGPIIVAILRALQKARILPQWKV